MSSKGMHHERGLSALSPPHSVLGSPLQDPAAFWPSAHTRAGPPPLPPPSSSPVVPFLVFGWIHLQSFKKSEKKILSPIPDPEQELRK